MSWRDLDSERDRTVRRNYRDALRHHIWTAAALAAQGAPAELIAQHHELAHEARLRSWGWLGPVPRMSGGAA
jgi:hypothetical protein